jgi:multiple sugar transport system substrate-binding protein
MGREGEVVQELVRSFEAANPGIRVDVQQIPWTAAHEKLLTSFVGRSTPDLAQLGNTWIAEFAVLGALEALDPWIARSSVVSQGEYFGGIWDTNVIDGTAYGIPWYVDTRVLFYRKDLLAKAGYDSVPGDWDGWREAMRAVKRVVGEENFAIYLPTNEQALPVIFGLQAGATLLREEATRGAFREPAFRRGFDFFLGLYQEGLAPSVGWTAIANVYQEFARGHFMMFITGPWNLGEFRHRLPPDLQDDWTTCPLPGPDGPGSGLSLAGGSSLVMFRSGKSKEAAWKLVEFLSQPEQQVRFYELTGDLPARRRAWSDPAMRKDPEIRAFEVQLDRTVATPKIPEWELIYMRVLEHAQTSILGGTPPGESLASLDEEVDRILEKRRWLVTRRRAR